MVKEQSLIDAFLAYLGLKPARDGYYPTLKEIREYGVGFSKDICKPNARNEALSPLVDKHNVKQIVADAIPSFKIAKEYLYVTNVSNITSELVSQLPRKYMLKATHLSGGVLLVDGDKVTCLKKKACIIPRKGESTLDWMKRACGKFMNTTMGNEKNYARIERGCLFEETLELNGMQEYKIHMFHGVPMILSIYSNRHERFHWLGNRNVFTTDWEEIVVPDDKYPRHEDFGERPKFLDIMLLDVLRLHDAAQNIAPVDYMRIDLFVMNETWAFEEYTFTDNACRTGTLTVKRDEHFNYTDLFYGFVGKNPELNVSPNAIVSVMNEYKLEKKTLEGKLFVVEEATFLKAELKAVCAICASCLVFVLLIVRPLRRQNRRHQL